MLVELSLFTLGAITFPSVFRLVSSRLYMVRDDYCRLDISVKIVSAIQAIVCVLFGMITMHYTKDDIVFTRFYLLDCYIYFWIPYFYYDAWALYQAFLVSKGEKFRESTTKERVKRFFRKKWLMMIHHLVLPPIYGPSILLFRQGKGDYLIGCAFLMEATIPFISVRNILLRAIYKLLFLKV
ncbi:FAM57A [Bugula neritina]|uniref:FAM57A n=1 Tax=Bugula neritina TaxID=10212 RepID=A0A7J7KFF8_BUGNE|nr:FAM57A [Bugula neritina]